MNIPMYYYLVEHKITGSRYVMMGSQIDINMGMGKYLYDLEIPQDCKYGVCTPYGVRSNICTGEKYNSHKFKIIHQTIVTEKLLNDTLSIS